MTDRALLFLVSLAAMLGAIASAIWLIATGQIGTFDGNFLLLSCAILALAFGLYLNYMIKVARRVESARPPAPQKKPVEEPVLAGKA